jgi:UDP-2,3-diacylglucosamine pyrophosphatase LpxH
VQGNYDNSVGNNLADCQCGYTDPQDNYFARLSYDYTFRNTSEANKAWMRNLPNEIRLELDGVRVLLCHGSPRKMNEFLWETTTSTAFLERLCEAYGADVIAGTHTACTGTARWPRENISLTAAPSAARQMMGGPTSGMRCSPWGSAAHRSRIHPARVRPRTSRRRNARREPARRIRSNHPDGLVDDMPRSAPDERKGTRAFLTTRPR